MTSNNDPLISESVQPIQEERIKLTIEIDDILEGSEPDFTI
jgi:hypothetical protein